MSDLSDNAIRAYAANIFDLEDAREEAQTDLKGAWSHIREAHGKRFADSLKLAVKRARQDADKRAAADEVDAEAERIMAILASRAPRATRIREIIEEFDPETGEVGTVAPALADDGQQANIKATPTIHEPEAAMLPQTAGSETAVANSTPGSGAGTVDAGEANWPSEMTTASPANEPQPTIAAQGAATLNTSDPLRSDAAEGNGAGVAAPDHSQPNPICRDPGDCGVYASWKMPCEACKRASTELQGAIH